MVRLHERKGWLSKIEDRYEEIASFASIVTEGRESAYRFGEIELPLPSREIFASPVERAPLSAPS